MMNSELFFKRISNIRIPGQVKINHRTSTIRGAFVKALIPSVPFSEEQLGAWAKQLNVDLNNDLICVYCGRHATVLDHFFPAVRKKLPTGFVTDLYNLVPSCSKCNESKSGSYWRDWMERSPAPGQLLRLSPQEIEDRISTLGKFEEWIRDKITIIPFDKLANDELYISFFKDCEDLLDTFKTYQEKADVLKQNIIQKVSNGELERPTVDFTVFRKTRN